MSLLITLLVGWILFGIEMDMFVPSFPELQQVFNLSPFMVELTLAANFIGHCITCLVIGGLGDRYGYRPIILMGVIIFVFGSILCVFATEYYILIFGRFLQGAGIAGTTTLSYLVITNVYSVEKQQDILGYANGVITIAMAIAPVIGSYIALFFHWRANFLAILIIGIINLICSYIFIPHNPPNPNTSLSFKEYKIIFRSKKTLYYIFTICLSVIPWWIFAGIAPILYMQDMGVTLYEFGFYQGITAVVFSIGSFGNAYIVKIMGTRKYVFFGIAMFILFLILCMTIIIMQIKNPVIITFTMVILAIAELPSSNILYPLMFDTLPEAKAKTSAILNALRMSSIAFGVQLVGYFYDGTFRVLGIVLCVAVSVMILCMYKLLIEEGEIKRLT